MFIPFKNCCQSFFWATGKIFCCFLFPGRDISQFVMFSRQLHNIFKEAGLSFLEDVGVNNCTSREIHIQICWDSSKVAAFVSITILKLHDGTVFVNQRKIPHLTWMIVNEIFWAIFKHCVCLFTFFACGKYPNLLDTCATLMIILFTSQHQQQGRKAQT